MKRGPKSCLRGHLILFALTITIALIYELTIIKRGLPGLLMIAAAAYGAALLLCALPSLPVRLSGKTVHFSRCLLFGLTMTLELLLAAYILAGTELINLPGGAVNAILLGKGLILLILIPLQVLLYDRVGLFYRRVLARVLERVLKVRLISEELYHNIPEEYRSGLRPNLINRTNSENRLFSSFINWAAAKFPHKYRKSLIVTALTLAALIMLSSSGLLGYLGYRSWYNSTMRANIVSLTPEGFTGEQALIEVVYDSEIAFAQPEGGSPIFKIEPAIRGRYRIEGRTLRFIPDGKLPPAARYQVEIDGSALRAVDKESVESRSFSFHTTMAEVSSFTAYYAGNELIGELHFNLPIEIDSLKERLKLSLEGEELPFSLESSSRKNIFYLKSGTFERADLARMVTLTILKGVMPVDGLISTGMSITKKSLLSGENQLKVLKVESHPVIGNTFISIEFNLAIEERGLKELISISPALPFELESEYRYAILKAPFKPNVNYTVKIERGVSARNGKVTKRGYKKQVVIRDMAPEVRFTSSGRILPYTDKLNLEFISINLDSVGLRMEKVFKNNLIPHLTGSGSYYRTGDRLIKEEIIPIEGGTINEAIPNLISLKSLMESSYRGFYYLTLSDPNGYRRYGSQLINVTNMGLIIKNDGTDLHAYVVDIMTLEPIPGVKLSLYSRENQLLKEGVSGNEGSHIFKAFNRTAEGLTPYLVLAERGDDFTYLTLEQNRLDYSSFDVSGTTFRRGSYDAFITTERGVYRPGEPVYVTAIVRSAKLANPAEIPLTVRVSDPGVNEVFKQQLKSDSEGIITVTIPTESSYKTGSYSLELLQHDEALIGRAEFKLEEFMPDTLEVKTELLERGAREFSFKVTASELHGAPAGGQRVSGQVLFSSSSFSHKDYRDFVFDNVDNGRYRQERVYLTPAQLDENGEQIFRAVLPSGFKATSTVKAYLYVEVMDSTGRTVGDDMMVELTPYEHYLGLKVEGARPFLADRSLKISCLAIDKDGEKVTEEELTLRIVRRRWYSIFKRLGWRGRFGAESYEELVYEERLRVDGLASIDFKPDKGGEYTVELSKDGGASSRLSFQVTEIGRDYAQNMSEPFKLAMSLDRSSYAVGETAYLTIEAPFEGKALLCWELDKLYNSRLIDLKGGRATVAVEVTEDFVPNMYLTAIAYRKPAAETLPLPPVSYGVINVTLDRERRSPKVELIAAEKIRAEDGLKVELKVDKGAGTKVIIAAVDEGILRITGFETPDPYNFFYRNRGLSVRTGTTLRELLPDIAPYKKAFGGGGGYRMLEQNSSLNPIVARKRSRALALYSGVLECDASGRVSHTFELPQFNGRLRVMAMTVKGKSFTATGRSVTVTDPIVISPGIPRFMSIHDKVVMPVKIFNKTGREGSFKVKVETDGPLMINGEQEQTVLMAAGGDSSTTFYLEGSGEAGLARIRLSAAGNGERTFSETELAVRPAALRKSSVNQGELKPGAELVLNVEGGYIKEGAYRQLLVSSNSLIRLMGGLDYLVNYPYGCTEQIISGAFPLLYLKEEAKLASLFRSNPYLIDRYINGAIRSLSERQMEDGRFGYWERGRRSYPWIDDYGAHFLLEARRLGYPVPEESYERIIKRISKQSSNRGRLDRRGERVYGDISYLLYLAALSGEPDYDRMRVYYERLNNKRWPLEERERCFLAAAYALSGDKERARAFLPPGFKVADRERTHSGSFRSYTRNTALYLYCLSLIDGDDPRSAGLAQELRQRYNRQGSFGNTQDTAWALLALGRVARSRAAAISVELSNEEGMSRSLTNESALYNEEIAPGRYRLVNRGSSTVYYTLIDSGIPLTPDNSPKSAGLVVSKKYLNNEGRPVNLKQVSPGDRIVVHLTVKYRGRDKLRNVVLKDLLPAGFEIVNTRLRTRGDYGSIRDNRINISNIDIRDDRILIFTDELYRKNSYSYVVKAVSSGEYRLPQFSAEAMYDPTIYGRTLGGEKVIIEER